MELGGYMKKENTFGSFVKEQRLGLRMTLRDFCLKNHLDCVVLSKIERGTQLPKMSELRRLCAALKILDDTIEFKEFFEIYDSFKQEPNDFSFQDLPVFLPPDISEDKILKLLDSLKESHSPLERELFKP